jgi:predicted metal-dependent hydrolase
MSDSKIIEFDGVGSILFEKSKRAKRIVISVRPFHGVRVAVPSAISFKKAEEFVYKNIDWVKRHTEKLMAYEQESHSSTDKDNNTFRQEAKAKLHWRLKQLANIHGFFYNRVFFRNQKTRWGSCSSKNNINLNIQLARLPDDLIDYVILHELLHTFRKDHSKAFWKDIDKLVGNGKKMSKRLKSYGMGLY